MMAPPVTWSVRAPGRARRRLLRGRGRVRAPGSGETETVGWGQGRVRALGSGEAEFVVFLGRGRVRALGRARWSFLWRPRLDLAAVSLTLSSGTAVGVAQAALSSCQVGQWSGEVTAVTSALSTDKRASG
jgi:hypothetical protein